MSPTRAATWSRRLIWPPTPPASRFPSAVAVTPDGKTAFVANYSSNTVTPIAVATNTADTPITVGTSPNGIAITPDGATAYVTNQISHTVTPIAVATNTPGYPITVGGPGLGGIAITPNGTTAYVTSYGGNGTVTPIAVATNAPGSPISLPAGSNPGRIAITPDGATAYVTTTHNGGTVTPIDLATNTPGNPIPAASNPVGIAITPDGATAYATNESNSTVTPIAVATNTPGRPISLPAGTGPWGIAITPTPRITSTSTQLNVEPPTPAPSGTTETLTATVTPSAAGSVQFTNGATPLGDPVAVVNGAASIRTTLPLGTHLLTAVFTPTNTTAFNGSTSPAVSYLVNAAAVVPGGNGPIVFASDRDGNSQIFVINADGSNQTRLTTNPASDTEPAFSPDGTRIAFTSNRDGNSEIYVMNADGGNQTRLRLINTGYALDPAFSPDGTRIAFTSNNPDGTLGIYVMKTDGSNQTLLTTNLLQQSAYKPAFSPDSTRMTFLSTPSGSPEIFVMNADGSNQTQLTPNSAANFDPHWGLAQATTTTLGVTPPSPAIAGSTETLTATTIPTTAAGSVQFKDWTTALGSPVSVSGGAASMTTILSSGPHSLTAAFTPTGSPFAPSTSAAMSYLVNAGSTITTLGVTPASPADKNTAETLTATITPTAAEGNVQFTDGTTPIGSSVTVANGTASMTTTLAPGTHSLTAMFAPTDSTEFGSSTSNTVSYVVNAPSSINATTTTLKVYPNRAFENFPVILLTNVAPHGATGTIQLLDGTTPMGAPVPVTAGFALTITTLPTGTHSLTAVFIPTNPATYAQSTSSQVPLTVNPLLRHVPLR